MEAEGRQLAAAVQELDSEILATRQAATALLAEEARLLEALRLECVCFCSSADRLYHTSITF